MTIVGTGWVEPKSPIKIDSSESSQFASAVMLAAWGLTFDLVVDQSNVVHDVNKGVLDASGTALPSAGYFEMTLASLSKAGMQIQKTSPNFLKISARSQVTAPSLCAELDVSSAFAVAALGAVGGCAIIKNFPAESLQPDRVFVSIFKKMGVDIAIDGETLVVKRTSNLVGIDQNLVHAPDLFPVLAALCSLAHGPSKLFGAKQLAHKESNRLLETQKLLNSVGARFDLHEDGMTIHGGLIPLPNQKQVDFDPAQDHRMAMAGALLNLAGANLRILTPEVVDKSFPEFWSLFP
jgi:3-phosphoshikimate 1-carboxyvinyltransferase